MSSWTLQRQRERARQREKAQAAECREAMMRIKEVRKQTEELATPDAVVAREREALLDACDLALAASGDRHRSEAAQAGAVDLEGRLDALRGRVVESAAEALEAETRRLFESLPEELGPRPASAETPGSADRRDEDVRAQLRSAIEVATTASSGAEAPGSPRRESAPRAAAAPATPASGDEAATERMRGELRAAGSVSRAKAAQAGVKAACAALAACVPALPTSARGHVAGELATLVDLATLDPAAAAKGFLDLRERVWALLAVQTEERRERRALHRSCAARLDRLTAAADLRPALAARAWDLRGKLAGILADSSAEDLRAILDEIDHLADTAEEALAEDESRATMDALIDAFEHAGYQVGTTDGGSFVARSDADIGLRVGADAAGTVRTEAVRLSAVSPVDADGVCKVVDDALDALHRDTSLPFLLAEQARHVPQPASELEFVDPGLVAWRATPAQAVASAAKALYHQEASR